MIQSKILITEKTRDYELLDSGEGEKLERFGNVTLSRPDPQALWSKRDLDLWKHANGNFTREEKGGGWSLDKSTPSRWEVELGDLKFWVKPTAFKHVGIFPEQSPNWKWLLDIIQNTGSGHKVHQNHSDSALSASRNRNDSGALEKIHPGTGIEVLNLFGYTGGATLSCAKAGANVVHIDGSKTAVNWARENAELSELSENPVRWIAEDARTFVKREIKRGRKYHGIIMDPPAFGHGPENELWKIEEHFLSLLGDCYELLDDKPLFFLINGYSAGYSALAYDNNLKTLVEKFGGTVEFGELAIKESTQKIEGRLLPAGIFARWSKP